MRSKLGPIPLVFVLALTWACGGPTAPRAASTATVVEPVSASALDVSYLAGLSWRNIGPNRGGRSIASSGIPSRPNEYYFGAVGGGLWKTVDGGATWKPVTDGQINSSSVGAIGVSESNPDVVYIGMGEACLRGNIMQGDGVYKSIDAGKTWTHMGLEDTQAIARVRVHPKNPDLVYVAAFGHPAAPNDTRGVFRSKDGGKTWQKILFRDNKTGAVDLVMDRNNPDVLYTALWEAYRVSWQMSSGGPGSGLFKTTDGGEHWTELTHGPGMPSGTIGRIGVAVSPADSKRVYAIVENEDGGVFVSNDAGATWTKVNEDRKLRQRAFYYTHIYADTKNRDTMYVLNTGFFKSTDGGKTYGFIEIPHGDTHDLWIDPNNPLRMINSNDGGAHVSLNGGQTWSDWHYPTAQLYHVATTKDFPYHVCGAQQDNSTLCVPVDGGRNSRDPQARAGDWLYDVGGGESGYIAPDPRNPNVFYAGSQGALLTRKDRTTGQSRDIQPFPRYFSGESAGSLPERWQWTFPIVFSPIDPSVIYVSSQHVWKTTNEGQTWEQISPDLTRADPKTLVDTGGPITKDQNGPEIYGTVFTIAPSKFDVNTIWTGSDDGWAFITRDGGKNWEKITPPGLPDFARISIIDASPTRPGTAFLAAKCYLTDDRAPYIYKTHDYGKTWTKIVDGIRRDDYVHAVREDPKRQGLLYAGTEHGIYVSFDDGTSWASLRLNLPDTQVSDMVVEDKDLVIATHGRSFWVLDNISVLRQLSPAVMTDAVHLFKPADVVRRAETASIDYYLKQPADKLTIEILDSKGNLVRRYEGARVDAGGYVMSGEEVSHGRVDGAPPSPVRAGVKAGANRLIWDVRYPAATPLPVMFMRFATQYQGPWAVPGTYQVRLTANGQTKTESFQVKLGPTVKGVSQADLQAQFDLSTKVRDRTTQAHETVLQLRDVRQQINDRVAKAPNAEQISTAAQALNAKLAEVEEAIYNVRLASGQDLFNRPIRLNNRLTVLEKVIESADAKPTDQCVKMLTQLGGELDGILGKYDAAMKSDLAQFNTLLASQNLPPVKVSPSPVAN